MTTNERMNAARYPRFHTGTKNHFYKWQIFFVQWKQHSFYGTKVRSLAFEVGYSMLVDGLTREMLINFNDGWSLVEVMKLRFGQDSEAEFWLRFWGCSLVEFDQSELWLKTVTLVKHSTCDFFGNVFFLIRDTWEVSFTLQPRMPTESSHLLGVFFKWDFFILNWKKTGLSFDNFNPLLFSFFRGEHKKDRCWFSWSITTF